jgi:prepilin-type N-terminal cleavage/methylation domain-containing protein
MCAALAKPSRSMHENNEIKGFSLVELLVSMMIGLLILFSVYQAFTIQSKNFKTQEINAEMLQNARVGIDFIDRELRMAGYNPTRTLNYCTGTNTATITPCVGITSAAGNSISFTADLNGNGNLTPDNTNPNENITYTVYTSGGVMYLGRTVNGTQQPVVMNISSLTFNYYDGSNQTTTNLALIRKIRVSVAARAASPDMKNVYRTITLSSDIVPKSLTN